MNNVPANSDGGEASWSIELFSPQRVGYPLEEKWGTTMSSTVFFFA